MFLVRLTEYRVQGGMFPLSNIEFVYTVHIQHDEIFENRPRVNVFPEDEYRPDELMYPDEMGEFENDDPDYEEPVCSASLARAWPEGTK